MLVGNSAGGNVAAQTALSYPDRVEGLILVDAAMYGHGQGEDIIGKVLSIRPLQRVGPLIVRAIAALSAKFADTSWHEPSKLTAKIRKDYQRQLEAHNWDFGFWEADRVGLPDDVSDRLGELTFPCRHR